MEQLKGTQAGSQRLISLGAITVLAAATALAFGRIFTGHATWRLLAAASASTAIACLTERRGLFIASLASLVGMGIAVGMLVFPDSTWFGLPTPETLAAARVAATQIGEQARVQVAPAEALPPLLLAAVTSTWAAVFSSHALSARAGSPLMSLVPPVALVAFADTVLEDSIRPQYGLLFLAGALMVVFADGLHRVHRWGPSWAWPGSSRRLSASSTRGARKVAVGAIGAAALFSAALPGWGARAVVDLNGNSNGAGPTIDPLVSIRASLTRGKPLALFDVTTERASYYRFVALDDFDGITWRPRLAPQAAEISPDSTLAASGDEQTFEQRFHLVSDMDLLGLPVAYPPVHAQVDATIHFDTETQTLVLDGGLDSGTDYTVTTQLVQPTSEELANVVFPTPALNARYTALPVDPTLDRIHQIALSWTQGQTSDYGRILAIQDHLRDGDFIYSIEVPARDDSYDLLTFLTQSKTGFCQQFASAMAVMLRTLGLPARLAVGFTAGTYDTNAGTWRISTENAHAWVEVLFPGYGWLAFEPTPGRTNPIAAPFNNPSSPCVPAPGVPCASEGQSPGQVGVTGRPGGGPLGNFPREGVARGSRGATFTGIPSVKPQDPPFPIRMLLLLVAAALALGLALVPPVRALRRRVRLRKASRHPRRLILATYEVFGERAGDLGLARGPGETPQEYRDRLVATRSLSHEDLASLTGLANLAAYSPRDPDRSQAQEAGRAAQKAMRDLRGQAGMVQRIVGPYRRSERFP